MRASYHQFTGFLPIAIMGGKDPILNTPFFSAKTTHFLRITMLQFSPVVGWLLEELNMKGGSAFAVFYFSKNSSRKQARQITRSIKALGEKTNDNSTGFWKQITKGFHILPSFFQEGKCWFCLFFPKRSDCFLKDRVTSHISLQRLSRPLRGPNHQTFYLPPENRIPNINVLTFAISFCTSSKA